MHARMAMGLTALATVLAAAFPPGASAPGGASRPLAPEGFATVGGAPTGGWRPGSAASRQVVIDARTAAPATALRAALESPGPAVVELRTDVDLGALGNGERVPLLHPDLVRGGVGIIHVASDKTVFSAHGATLRNGTLALRASHNVVLRNLRFRGLWEWDEATSGAYDRQGWDFVVLDGATRVWIDHCDFGRAYDAPLDIVRGSDLVTVSWSRFGGDGDGIVARQVAHLEALYQADPGDPQIRFYAGRRRTLSAEEIVRDEVPQTKGSLVGNSDEARAVDEGRLNVTFHHNVYEGVRQRTPRVRFGNVHVYNVLVDDTALAGPRGTRTGVNSTQGAAVLVENSVFREVATPLAFASGGRVAQRGSLWWTSGKAVPFERARLDPPDPAALVWNAPRGFSWEDRKRLPYVYRLDPVEDLPAVLATAGVLRPASEAERDDLARRLPRTVER